jgi:hypothetical protein
MYNGLGEDLCPLVDDEEGSARVYLAKALSHTDNNYYQVDSNPSDPENYGPTTS